MEKKPQYFFDWSDKEELLKDSDELIVPSYSSARGEQVEGEKIRIAFIIKKRGTGSRQHHHPNEQMFYILKGGLKAKVGDQEKIVRKGGVIHIPPNVVHQTIAIAEEDCIYI
jgi:quercetin dioxygenase-like cupin family protein